VQVKVFLAGGVAIETDGVASDEACFPGRQGRLLFAYLVAEQGRPVPRDELAEALWGETPPATWDKALTVLVSKLRGLLTERGLDGPSVLTSAFGCYRLDFPKESWVDLIAAVDAVQEAEAALAAGELDSAKAAARLAEPLVRKPFLPGESGAWVEEKRRELADVRGRALNVLADSSLRSGEAHEAARWAELAIGVEPFRETGYRRLMEAHAAAGNRAEALRVYERCRRLLQEELGAYPSPETESIFRELLEAPAAQRTDATSVPLLSGHAPSSFRPRRAQRRSALLVLAGVLLAAGVAVAVVASSGGRDSNLGRFRTIPSGRCSALHYEGAGSPQLLIAADLPLQAGVLETTTPMVEAITLALERRKYTAGPYRVGLQVCDDATPDSVPVFDAGTCTANAYEYARSPSVVGVVGPLVSGCAMLEIPILNRASGGPVAIVSSSATVVGLTRSADSAASDQPGVLYPSGRRNYARVVPADDVQAAADAILARRLGVKRVYALDDGEPIGQSFVDDFIRTSRRLGVAVAGRASWDPLQQSYARLADAIAPTRADGVFLGVNSGPESVRLLTDLRARLGSAVQFIAPEVFDPTAAVLAGAVAEGMAISQPGPPSDHLTGEGKQFVASFSRKFGGEPTRYAVAAAQAIDVMLDAIGHSDGSRASVTRNLFATSVSNGILGSFSITPTGDTTLNTVTIYRIIAGKATTFTTIVVPDALVGPG
jgi:DNA-binding SARP family transcriptional activator/ABC-type branched-subunit amino acid transport system substrate-binding protein